MSQQKTTPQQERKLKFAEAGVLFVLVLGLTIFIGARLVGHDEGAEPVAVVAAESVVAAPVETVVSESESVVVMPVHPVEAAAVVPEVVEVESPREVTYALAEETFFAGRYAEAADLFTQYTAAHPDNAWGFYMLGLSAWKADQADEAEEAFLAALDLKPDHVKSLVNFGRVLLDQDRAAEAQVQLQLALDTDPTNLDARRVLGRSQHNQGQLDDAAASYLVVLTEREDDVWSLNNLGLIRIQQERFSEALPPLARAAQLQPDVAVIQNNLGVALERSGYPAAAAQAFELALEADGGHAKAEISLARVEGQADGDATSPLDLAALALGFDARQALTGTVTLVADSLNVAIPDEFAIPAAELEMAASLPGTEAGTGSVEPDQP